jgi:transcriptional regulator with XRE-family HTH domain
MANPVHYDASRLFQYLENKGIVMAWLARQCGYSDNYLTLIKTGRKPATSAFAKKASAVLEVDMALLFMPIELSERNKSLSEMAVAD